MCLFFNSVVVVVDFFKEIFVLEVEKNSGLFDAASVEDLLDDFFTSEGLAGVGENLSDNVGDSSLFVAPTIKSVNAAAN